MTLPILILSLLAPSPAPPRPASPPPFTATEMMRLQRLADPQVSPDGRWIAYQSTQVDTTSWTRNTDIWIVAAAGGAPRRLTEDARSDTRPRWSPDGRRIAFLSTRDGGSQVWLVDAAGGTPRQVTSLPTEVGGVLWADERTLVVTSDVHPECGPAAPGGAYDAGCNRKRMEAAIKPSAARAYDGLLVRHWNTWEDRRRSHLHAVDVASGDARDLTPGEADVPPFSVGGPDDYDVSPDGREIAFARKDPATEAFSTDAELFVAPVAGGAVTKVSGSPGYDGQPRYSPDGTMIAFRAQVRAGFEADRWRLMVYDRATRAVRNLTEPFDRQVGDIAWSPDSRTLFFTAEDQAKVPVFAVAAAGGPVRTVAGGASFGDLRAAPDGRSLVATAASLTHPAEVYRIAVAGGTAEAVTHANDAVLEPFRLRAGESVTYAGAAGKDVQAWVVRPADFDPARRYPLLVLIHGGPQGEWGDAWSYRWNPQVFAAAGYVVFMPNPRGSIGWGQEFVDDVSGDWGGRAYEDVMRGTDFAEALPYVEKGRTAAAGASYGGYMVNWIAGHTDRYRVLVSHDGVFDLRSMYLATEELWFPEWEFRGTPWTNPEMYDRWSASRFVQNFKTPTLVVHGELDYRVPLEQGLGMYTALQRQGVPSRLLVFPDEGHWVLQPANSVRWYQEVIGWIDRWLRAAAS
jgi:dipeptidyl aminopeptidase/acylaminoacyl peptidase